MSNDFDFEMYELQEAIANLSVDVEVSGEVISELEHLQLKLANKILELRIRRAEVESEGNE